MDIARILEYLEKHFSWRTLVTIILCPIMFCIGYYFCSAQRDKQEAILINRHTKDIKSYCDSANSYRNQSLSERMRYELIIRDKQKTIDSLNDIINSNEDESDK